MLNTRMIKALMKSKGITGEKLAALAGVSSSMMSYILSGMRDPSVPTLVRIASALECTVDELLVK